MNLEGQFRVDVPVEQAWAVLLDLERIAPCMPGAQLQEVEGDEYRGTVKVKVGPITAQYKGAARFVEVDEAAHRAVIKADGRDTRGQGNAAATITAVLTPDGSGTQVQLTTDLTVSGKVAQFGRGVMADVSTKLLGQFVDCLARDVFAPADPSAEAPAGAPEEPAPPPPAPEPPAPEPPAPAPEGTVRSIDAPEAEPVDLMRAAGGAVAKRLVPVVLVVAAVVVVIVILVAR